MRSTIFNSYAILCISLPIQTNFIKYYGRDSNRMGEDVIQRGIQFPKELYDELSKIAKQKNISYAAIVREACISYISGNTPGLCSLCHIQNNPEAQYCQGCGTALNPDAQGRQMETLNNVIETLKQLDERMQVLEKKVSNR